MPLRHLLNEDGAPFQASDLDALTAALDALPQVQRKEFRDANSAAIATHPAERMLIVSGPGTGKSTLFKHRILVWLERDSAAKILALSFVRKLVADLDNDINNNDALTNEQKSHVVVHTLHKYARSIVEQNHGTKQWGFAPHFRIIGQSWKEVVWDDVLLLNDGDHKSYPWKAFEKQLHNDRPEESEDWEALANTYFSLSQYYNAAGFADLILRARDALAENAELSEHQYFIFDEYQDFNASEEGLLGKITKNATATLLVGDDDQVLYETLKEGKASLIRTIYADKHTVNAMLPFCGRCDFHITRAASYFIKQGPDANSIRKIYLPMSGPDASQRVRVVGCATPTTAVDYIRKFIEEHAVAIQQRKAALVAGESKDAYLLILSPSATVDFYRPDQAQEQLFELIEPFRETDRGFSEEYYRVLTFYSLANYPSNNFTFRKALHYKGVSRDDLRSILEACLSDQKPIAAIDAEVVKDSLATASSVRGIIEGEASAPEKVEALSQHIRISDPGSLQQDLEKHAIDKQRIDSIEHQEEENAELEEIEVKRMSAVELMTIVGSKGLSADHVVIVGFDDVNMRYVTRNAFYVAMTRARHSLHLLTALKGGGATKPHHFLSNLPDENLEFAKYTKSERQTSVLDKPKLMSYLEYLRKQAGRDQRFLRR